MPEWNFNNPESIKAWEDISAEYAKQVSGKIRAVVGKQLREGNIWENVELPKHKHGVDANGTFAQLEHIRQEVEKMKTVLNPKEFSPS
jgi:hypothetical protein